MAVGGHDHLHVDCLVKPCTRIHSAHVSDHDRARLLWHLDMTVCRKLNHHPMEHRLELSIFVQRIHAIPEMRHNKHETLYLTAGSQMYTGKAQDCQNSLTLEWAFLYQKQEQQDGCCVSPSWLPLQQNKTKQTKQNVPSIWLRSSMRILCTSRSAPV